MPRSAVCLSIIALLLSAGQGDPPVRPVPPTAESRSLSQLQAASGVGIYRLTLEGALFQQGKSERTPQDLELVLVRVGDRWEASVAGRAPGFNQGAHKGRVRDTAAGVQAVPVEMQIGSDRWVPGDDNAPYQLKLRARGGQVTGTYTGQFRDTKVSGRVSGRLEGPGWYGCRPVDGGADFAFDMGTARRNWNHARWGGYNFLAEMDVSAFDGVVLTVETDTPRQDAWVDLAVMEKDGSCYLVRDAIPLADKRREVYVAFDDLRQGEFLFNGAGTGPGVEGNFDEDFHFDRTSLYRMMIGVVNPLGVGEVDFGIRDVRFVTLARKPVAEAPTVRVTGQLLQVNRQTDVPGGIFGFHVAGGRWSQVDGLRTGSIRPLRAMGHGGSFVAGPRPELGIDLVVSTNYDRKQQLPQIAGPVWKQKMAQAGQGIGNQAKGKTGVAVEFWNEPYLDLGRMLEKDLARRVKPPAGTQAGDPVVFHGREMESMVWVNDGGKLVPRDPSRFTYWSGRQIGKWYTDAFLVVAGQAKKIVPDLPMIGGFGFRWSEDEWAAWDLLYKDLIDRSIDVLDGVCEHHYQGYTDGMAASYEVLTAYAMARHGKWLKAWNTETNDLWDAPARGNAYATHQFGGAFRARRRMVYNLRDILYCIAQTPDKIEARAIHALWKSRGGDTPWARAGIDKGEWYALDFLRNLRGRMVRTVSADDEIWAVASVDEKTQALVVVVYNDGPEKRNVRLDIRAPGQTRFTSLGVTELGHDDTGEITLLGPRKARLTAEDRAQLDVPVAAASATRLDLKLDRLPGEQAGTVHRRQIFAQAPAGTDSPILHHVAGGKSITLPFDIPAETARARRASVRLIVERVADGEAWFVLGGRRYDVPKAHTPPNAPYIREVAVEPADLAGAESITFHGAGNGWRLCAASVVVETEE